MSDHNASSNVLDKLLTDDDNISLEILGKSVWLIAKICLPLFIGAIILAPIFFSLKIAVIAGIVSFFLMIFIAIPLVLATYEDEVIEGGEGH